MKIVQTPISGLIVIEPRIFKDNRGYFFESYNEREFIKAGITVKFVQDNESSSEYGVIRGLHYQLAPHNQAKLVRVIDGNVFDVAVDLRRDSSTYGQWFGVELSGENKKQLFIPHGFAHGFSVLSQTATFAYKCDDFYAPECEGGIAFDDQELAIDWKIDLAQAKISDKDKNRISIVDAIINF